VKDDKNTKEQVTKEELAKHNGIHGSKSYIAFKYKVYDLSGSHSWKSGIHMNTHHAGADLTEALSDAPHGTEVLTDFPVVGKYVVLEKATSITKRCLYYLSTQHIHAISVHFSVSSFVLSPLFLIIFLVFPTIKLLENLSFYLLIIGYASLPFSIATGLLDWWSKFSFDMSNPIKKKLIFTLLLLLTAIICLIWRFYNKNLILERQSYFLVYVCLNLSLFVYDYFLGSIGGQLVYPSLTIKKLPRKKDNKGLIEILKIAIPREKEAYNFYKKLKMHTKNSSQKSIIDFLAHQEKIHEAKLEEILNDLTKKS
jgi:predicted heme/steroid binding protein